MNNAELDSLVHDTANYPLCIVYTDKGVSEVVRTYEDLEHERPFIVLQTNYKGVPNADSSNPE